jgi:NAD-dependent deacetylase
VARPNAAHDALARTEQELAKDDPTRFYLCTQNVDDLHEQAGSRRIHHMHGSLFESRCVRCDRPFADSEFYETEPLPVCRECGATVRPHIVWFGEMPYHMDVIQKALARAEVFVAVGTSGHVYPAAGFVEAARAAGARTIEVNLDATLASYSFHEHRTGPATVQVPRLIDELLAQDSAA